MRNTFSPQQNSPLVENITFWFLKIGKPPPPYKKRQSKNGWLCYRLPRMYDWSPKSENFGNYEIDESLSSPILNSVWVLCLVMSLPWINYMVDFYFYFAFNGYCHVHNHSHSDGLTVIILGTIMDMVIDHWPLVKQWSTEEEKGRHRKLKLKKGNYLLQFLPHVKEMNFAALRPCKLYLSNIVWNIII